jgi:hypothetical protein
VQRGGTLGRSDEDDGSFGEAGAHGGGHDGSDVLGAESIDVLCSRSPSAAHSSQSRPHLDLGGDHTVEVVEDEDRWGMPVGFIEPFLESFLERRDPLVDELGAIDDLDVQPAAGIGGEATAKGADER